MMLKRIPLDTNLGAWDANSAGASSPMPREFVTNATAPNPPPIGPADWLGPMSDAEFRRLMPTCWWLANEDDGGMQAWQQGDQLQQEDDR